MTYRSRGLASLARVGLGHGSGLLGGARLLSSGGLGRRLGGGLLGSSLLGGSGGSGLGSSLLVW